MPDTPAAPTDPAVRSLAFRARRNPQRYWWYWGKTRQYIPDVYGCLRQDEWKLFLDWHEETERIGQFGEMAIPMVSMLRGFIMGSGVSSVVQLGHWMGYSTLLLGFALRRMRLKRALFSIDIDKPATEFTQSWIDRAQLNDQVALHLGDSADVQSTAAAIEYLGRAPQVVIIDSSHQYSHTLRELDLWYDRLAPGGMLFLHDVSEYAATFDGTGMGGVRRAAREWIAKLPPGQALLIDGNADPAGEKGIAYADGCGLGIIHKPVAIAGRGGR